MNEQTVRALGFIFACQARVAGMQAQNHSDFMVDRPNTYSPDHFFAEAGLMERIAHELQS